MAIAVVGSGPSGLAAGFRLREMGYPVRVFESNDVPGGKMRTTYLKGYPVEEGASVMSRAYRAILGVAADAGLTDNFVEANAVFGFPRDGKVHYFDPGRLVRDGFRTDLLSLPSKLKLARIAAACVRRRKQLSDGDLAALADLDGESAEKLGTRLLGHEAYTYLVDPALRGLAGCSPQDISQLDLLYCFNNFLGVPRFVAFQGGMGSYAKAVADRLDVALSAKVLSVEERPSEVLLSWRDASQQEHTESFDACVLATPAPVVRDILGNACDDIDAFLRNVKYTSMININIGLDRVPARIPASFIPTSTKESPELVGIILEHNKVVGRVPAGRGHLVLGGSTEFSTRFWEESDDKCADALCGVAEQILPRFKDAVDFVHVTRWSPLVLQAYPGYYRALSRFRGRFGANYRRVALAGDFHCTSNVNSATVAGERAAARVADLVKH